MDRGKFWMVWNSEKFDDYFLENILNFNYILESWSERSVSDLRSTLAPTPRHVFCWQISAHFVNGGQAKGLVYADPVKRRPIDLSGNCHNLGQSSPRKMIFGMQPYFNPTRRNIDSKLKSWWQFSVWAGCFTTLKDRSGEKWPKLPLHYLLLYTL